MNHKELTNREEPTTLDETRLSQAIGTLEDFFAESFNSLPPEYSKAVTIATNVMKDKRQAILDSQRRESSGLHVLHDEKQYKEFGG